LENYVYINDKLLIFIYFPFLLFQAWRRTQYRRRWGRGPKTAPYRGNS